MVHEFVLTTKFLIQIDFRELQRIAFISSHTSFSIDELSALFVFVVQLINVNEKISSFAIS